MIKLIVWQCPRSLNGLLRMYKYPWKYAKYRDGWSLLLKCAASPNERSALGQMAKAGKRVRLSIVLQHTRLYDRDNLFGSVKPILDSMKNLQWIADDSEIAIQLEVLQEKGQPDKTTIRLELI